MSHFDDLSGQERGIWKIIRFDHMKYLGVNHRHGMSYYECECKKCGAIKIVARGDLTHKKCMSHRGCEVKIH